MITINEAIEILSEAAYNRSLTFNRKFEDALELGIEALQRVKLQRNPEGCVTERLLPGETEK